MKGPQFAWDWSNVGAMPSRRDWLKIGFPALLAGLSYRPPSAQAKAAAAKIQARAKSVMVIFTSGGQSQLDTWDPKPNAPAEIRGEFSSIATATPGVRLVEHLPKLATMTDKYCILRSMTHDDLDHGSACYLALTGQFHPRKSSNPPPGPNDFPSLGAVLHRVRPTDRFPHSAFHVNGPLLVPKEPSPGQYGGFLGRGYNPIEMGNVSESNQLLAGLSRPDDISSERADSRKGLVDQLGKTWGNPTPLISQESIVQQAYELMDSAKVRSAFDLDQEPAKVRERYGRYRAGQACLMGRRLVEAGVPWVTVFFNHTVRGQDTHPADTDMYGWDTHNDIFEAMKDHLLPRFDQSISTLLEDMDQRGLLKDTLVVIMGEFGRAPLVAIEKNFAGSSPGRKHWAACYSILLAGAGVTPGIYGSSDRQAAYPQANPVTPGDLAATLFWALGLDPESHYADQLDRPLRTTTGNPVTALFS